VKQGIESGSEKSGVKKAKAPLSVLQDLFDYLVFTGVRRPDRERAAHAGIRIVPVPVRAADLGRSLHVLPALNVISACVIEADVKIFRAPGRKGRGPPLLHCMIAMWADSLVFLHFILHQYYFPISRSSFSARLSVTPIAV
jgi:hypothetical protein